MNDFKLRDHILFEDAEIIALNKPSGLLSIEDGYDLKKVNLRTILRDTYGAIWAVHRLDKDTSGVIIFAKNENAHRSLNSSFSNRDTVKNYRGIVNGMPVWESFEITIPLRINGDRNHRTVCDFANGKPAITRINKIRNCEKYSYLDIFPSTGITHQIRAHLSIAGFPILGDKLYWRCCEIKNLILETQRLEFNGFFLHAYSLKIAHPVTNNQMQITAPIPASFSQMLENLGLNCEC